MQIEMTSFASKKYTDKNGITSEEVSNYSFIKDVISCFIIVCITQLDIENFLEIPK